MDNKPHKNDADGECHERGKIAESSFQEIAESRGFSVKDATRNQQFSHIDFILNDGKREIKVDVKAQKKVSRKDSDVQDDLCWVEICGVTGNSSWLYGSSDIIAFERDKHYLLINRKDLIEIVHDLCDFSDWVNKPSKALYKSYKRFKRPKEHLTIIKFSDIEKLAKNKKWSKTV